MDELIVLMKTLMEKVDRIEVALEEIKDQQRPLSSKDYIHSLKNEAAVELDKWLTTVKITKKQGKIYGKDLLSLKSTKTATTFRVAEK